MPPSAPPLIWLLMTLPSAVATSWRLFFSEGPQLPWFRVLRMTSSPESALFNMPWIPAALIAATVVAVLWIWQYGERLAAGTAAVPVEASSS